MVVTYSQNGYSCVLTIPAVESFKAGVGRPLSIADDKKASLQDAKNGQVLASQLFQVVDWQGHKLWNVNSKGAVSKAEFNGTILGDYWVSIDAYADVQWGIDQTSSFVIDLAAATVSDGTNNLGKFVDVYTDKHIDFVPNSGTGFSVQGNKATITDWEALDDVAIVWTNNGNSVTENIFISVPVYINYIWGQKVLLGNAVLTIQPTLQGKN